MFIEFGTAFLVGCSHRTPFTMGPFTSSVSLVCPDAEFQMFVFFFLALCDNGCVSGRGGFHLLMPMIALNAPCEVGLKHQFEFGKVYFTRLNLPFVEGLDPCPAVSMCQHLERCRGHDARMGSGRARRITLVNDKHLVVIQLYFAPMWQQTLECPRTLESK